ncbi:MAG: STAS-like domain-containing protein [Candidatus Gracilibacteria bacterium]
MKINIIDIIKKKIAISTDDGKQVREVIIELFDTDDEIEISFDGISMLISHFLNESIGKLYIIYPKNRWDKLDNIIYTNISKDDLDLLKTRVIPNYKDSLTDREKFENIQKDILKGI